MLRTLAGSFPFSLCSLVSMGQTPKEATEPLHVKKFVAPAYPDAARKNRMQATTTAEIQVGADGAVDFVKVVMAHPVFHDYVEAALKQWTFDPIAKPARLKVNVRFWLDACGDLARSNQGEPIVGETVVKADLPDNVEVRTCLDPIVTNVN